MGRARGPQCLGTSQLTDPEDRHGLHQDRSQAARECLTGIWAATTATFDGQGALDLAGLRRDLDRLTGSLHIDGVFCGGVMSEFWSLSGSERRCLVEVVVDTVRGHAR